MIKWITDKLGTASYYDYEKLPDTMEAVLIDVRELADKEGNATDLVRAKIQEAQEALRQENRVVICCDKGISRSNAIALGVLVNSGVPYEEAMRLLSEKVNVSEINLGLLHDVCSPSFKAQKQPGASLTNILITGPTGFVGRAVVDRLSEEYNLFCPGRDELALAQDIALLDMYVNRNNVDLIIHLAHPRMRNSVSAIAESIAMMRNILEVCRLNKVEILYLSGLVVFSGYSSKPVLKASSSLPPWPKGLYGETKLLCEELIKLYQKNYDLKATILRPAALYGKGMDRSAFICKFFEWASKNVTIRTHRYDNGTPVFDFLYLDDLVDAIRLALQIKPKVVLNIGTGRGTSTYQLAQIITKISASASSVEMIDINDKTYKVIADTSEAKHYLNWQAKTNLETGLRELWTWSSL